MTIADDASVLSLPGKTPRLHASAFVASGARIIGDVTLGEGASVWYNAVVRGDSAAITLGEGSNLQDNVSVHVDAGHPVVIGSDVSVGHNAVVHGCAIGDGSLVGMGSVILSGARIGRGCLIAGGAVVLEGTVVPDGSLVAGVPAKVRRELTDEEKAGLLRNAQIYRAHSARSRRGDGAALMRIEELAPDEVFVFGSNAHGAHGGGAARFAHERFGAVWGQAEGLQGQSYAIDTMSGLDVFRPRRRVSSPSPGSIGSCASSSRRSDAASPGIRRAKSRDSSPGRRRTSSCRRVLRACSAMGKRVVNGHPLPLHFLHIRGCLDALHSSNKRSTNVGGWA